MRIVVGLTAALALSACGGDTPTAPSRSVPGADTPAGLSVTLHVRSGEEGLPPLEGATVRLGDRQATTDAAGLARLDGVSTAEPYVVEAAGHLSYRAGPVKGPENDVVLWPLSAGIDARWISLTSYYGPDYDVTLWRPTADIVLSLEGTLRQAPARAVWEGAVAEVQRALATSGRSSPGVRIGLDEAAAIPVTIEEAPTCQQIRWPVADFVLTPPPRIALASAEKAVAPETVLEIVTALTGFNLSLARRSWPPGGSRTTLSPPERTALRMRMLRPPGAQLVNGIEDVALANPQTAALEYFCR